MKRIPLRDKFGRVKKWCLVDDEDYKALMVRRWQATKGKKDKTWYATANIKFEEMGKHISTGMHRVILNAPRGKMVDHINGNGLDNRKANLRICTNAENQNNRRRLSSNNTSGYRGVQRSPNKKKWIATIRVDRKPIHLGTFKDKIDAISAYNEAAKKYHGEFAVPNRKPGRPKKT